MFDVRWCWRQHRGTRVLHVHESGRAQPTGGAGLGEIKGGLKSAGSDKQGLSQQKGSARNFGVATRTPGETSSKETESCIIVLITFLRALKQGRGVWDRVGDLPLIRGLITFCTIPAQTPTRASKKPPQFRWPKPHFFGKDFFTPLPPLLKSASCKLKEKFY